MGDTHNSGLIHTTSWWADFWTGTAEQLIAAGIVAQHMLPGEPGQNKTCVTYGTLNRKTNNRCGDYMQILRKGKKKYRVTKAISVREEKRRSALLAIERLQNTLDAEITGAAKSSATNWRPAQVIKLPTADMAPVVQRRKQDTLPSTIASFSEATHQHRRRAKRLEEIREQRDLCQQGLAFNARKIAELILEEQELLR
jgi:hypothetical protein